MIDIESVVFERLATKIKAYNADCLVTSEIVNAPLVFPSVGIVEADNYQNRFSLDSSNTEKFVNVMYEINIYTNGINKRSEAKQLLQIIDNELISIGFVRQSKTQIPTESDIVYRLVIRYTAGISNKQQII